MNKKIISSSFLPAILKRTGRYSILLVSAIAGMFVGLFVLFPLHEVATYYDRGIMLNVSLPHYLMTRILDVFLGRVSLIMTEYWMIVGAFLGVFFFFIFKAIHKNAQIIRRLSSELEKSFPVLLSQGESTLLEFKSSFRWDVNAGKVNRNLENVVVKTLAAFLNSDGGTLLIGVDDNGDVVGLENDYKHLKKHNRDGFEQAIMTLISTKLGTTTCGSILLMFHSFDGKDACRIIAMPSPRPIYVKDGSITKFYIRTGCSSRELNLQDAVDYISLRWNK
jgi:hypothetical protein